MTKEQAIKKYKLIRENLDFLGEKRDLEVFSRSEKINGVETVWTVQQDQLAKEQGENLFFLIIERYDFNKIKTNRYGMDLPQARTKVIKLEN